eukprot:SAG31_NODE_5674_length_2390_cov_36.986469_1_plen_253_part_00
MAAAKKAVLAAASTTGILQDDTGKSAIRKLDKLLAHRQQQVNPDDRGQVEISYNSTGHHVRYEDGPDEVLEPDAAIPAEAVAEAADAAEMATGAADLADMAVRTYRSSRPRQELQRQSSRPKKAAGPSGVRSASPQLTSRSARKAKLDTRGPGSSRPTRDTRSENVRRKPQVRSSKAGGRGSSIHVNLSKDPTKMYAEILKTVDQAITAGVSEEELFAMCNAISGADSALAEMDMDQIERLIDRDLAVSAHA